MYQKYAELRDAAGVSDREIARRTGISPETLSAWKRGLYRPKVDKLMKIAKYFDVGIEALIGG